ncbi:hypothetical protein [Rufibacter psychrotolerans]|uniref:hypothetical protein n=1 Tax=Rufibacter psychrotolerans TaxID=2812556 RepID=UPI001F07D913|nr:hypothetical protein [Rufibacter sp. SYSU D00308]
MRKALPFFLLLLTVSLSAFSQAFEGKVTYAMSYKSKMPAISDDQFAAMMGDTQEYFIKGGSYKSVLNGTLLQWQLYPSQDSALYNKMSTTEAVYWLDARSSNDQVLKAELHKGVTEILGYQCDELVLTCTSGIQRYYFTSKLPVDHALFARHKYGNWFAYLEKARAIPLKIVVENAQLVSESVAIEVKPMKLEKSLFQLTTGSRLEKMPF